VFVADPANGCIHRFRPTGYWEKCLAGFGNLTHIAIDCQDHLYVVDEGNPGMARVVDRDGREVDPVTRVEDLASDFPPLPFTVDAGGNIDLSSLCAAGGPTAHVFDPTGNLTAGGPATTTAYEPTGTYLSEPLDSKLYHCQWHRIVLRGSVPAGSSVLVETYTAEANESITQITNLPDDLWETKQVVKEIRSGDWDCLVRNAGGRFLWLRLTFKSRGSFTPVIESIRVEFPRVSLRRFLPAVFAAEPTSADFTDRFLSVFDTILRSVENQVDQQASLFDPLSAPAGPHRNGRIDFLSWLGSWIGVTLDRHWPEAKRRRFLKHAAQLFHLRGTREGLWRQLLLLLDFEPDLLCCTDDQPRTRCLPAPANCAPFEKKPCGWQPPPLILEHFQLRRWLFLGAGRLGDQAVLWGKRIVNRSQLDEGAQLARTQLWTIPDPHRDPFHFYAHKFTVFVPAAVANSDRRRKALENLLNTEKPAHTISLVEFVAPRFRVGVQSMIGFDSVVGRYPSSVTLNQSVLGEASVLTAPPHRQGGPSLEIGDQSRIGTATRLE
jgi:phage tail-like protein